MINITIPVYNEEKRMGDNVLKLYHYIKSSLKYPFEIIIADNGSTDNTPAIAKQLSYKYPEIKLLHIEQKGKGIAINTSWSRSKADILSFMDVDLSADLKHFQQLIDAILKDGYDITIGSRLITHKKVKRSLKREIISRCYSFLLKLAFFVKFHDAPCGFKAIKKEAADRLLPLINDAGWFFDSKLLIIGEKLGFKIKEIPIEWIDDPGSKVNIPGTAYEYLKAIFLLKIFLNGTIREYYKKYTNT